MSPRRVGRRARAWHTASVPKRSSKKRPTDLNRPAASVAADATAEGAESRQGSPQIDAVCPLTPRGKRPKSCNWQEQRSPRGGAIGCGSLQAHRSIPPQGRDESFSCTLGCLSDTLGTCCKARGCPFVRTLTLVGSWKEISCLAGLVDHVLRLTR